MFPRLSVKGKFILLAVVLFIGMGCATAISVSLFRTVADADAARALVTQRQELLRSLNAGLGYGGLIHSFKNAVLRGDKKFTDRASEAAKTLDGFIADYRDISGLSAAEGHALDVLAATIGQYADATRQVADMRMGGVTDIAEIDRAVKINDGPALEAFAALYDEYSRLARETAETTDAEISRSASLIPSALAATALLFLVLLVLNFRALMRQLGGEPALAAQAVRTMAGGDLSAELATRPDDSTSLMADMARMRRKLRTMMTMLQESAAEFDRAAEQVSGASGRVAEGSARQSEAASSIAAVVEQMTVSVGHVSGNASEAQEVSARNEANSVRGAQVIDSTAAEIRLIAETATESAKVVEELGQQTAQIGGIASVIKEIADQTNLLALNAAIEAARAGESGRGFAVVADEVRKLAEQTATSTAEIGTVIDTVQRGADRAVQGMQQMVGRVGQGVQMAERAGQAIGEMRDGARHILGAVSEISTALQQQAAASSDIAAHVESIARMSEENDRSAREAAGTAGEPRRLADRVQQAARQFRI